VHKKWCHFGWGGKEILKRRYEVLVLDSGSAQKVETVTADIEDFLDLEARTFTVRGVYEGVTGIEGEFRVSAPQPLESCGLLVSRSAREPRTPAKGSAAAPAGKPRADTVERAERVFVELMPDRALADAELLPSSALLGQRVKRPGPTDAGPARLLRLQRPFMAGEDVLALQRALAANGLRVTVDGVYGPETVAAVVAYQDRQGLSPDGVVGPKTSASLGL
jgi:hypothetical protein